MCHRRKRELDDSSKKPLKTKSIPVLDYVGEEDMNIEFYQNRLTNNPTLTFKSDL